MPGWDVNITLEVTAEEFRRLIEARRRAEEEAAATRRLLDQRRELEQNRAALLNAHYQEEAERNHQQFAFEQAMRNQWAWEAEQRREAEQLRHDLLQRQAEEEQARASEERARLDKERERQHRLHDKQAQQAHEEWLARVRELREAEKARRPWTNPRFRTVSGFKYEGAPIDQFIHNPPARGSRLPGLDDLESRRENDTGWE